MTTNFPGPYTLELLYTVNSKPHKANYNISIVGDPDVGDAFGTIVANLKGGGTDTLENICAAWVALIGPFFNNGTATFNEFILWKNIPDTLQRTYVSSQLEGSNGTSASATVLASQAIFSFRTAENGRMSLAFMEVVQPPGTAVAYASLGTGQKNLVDFVIGPTSWLLGRDTSVPVSFIMWNPGQNEKTFRERHR